MDIFYPVKIFAEWLTYRVFSISSGTLLAEAVKFFIYDTIKIFFLLAVIIFTVSIIRSFLPPEKIKKILSHKNKYAGNILAAVFGIITPFCTCSAIPLFLGFIDAGVPLGATFSFLVSSPMINEVALVMLLGMFGLKIALLYTVSGLVIAILSGIIIGQLKLESLVENIGFKPQGNSILTNFKLSWKDRVKLARGYTLFVIKGVWPYIIVG
ncbi:MAG: permease, partial [Candidatus Parcubacteria bacterium]|nr:permease [Candidatus Parcubacteria bacterium]